MPGAFTVLDRRMVTPTPANSPSSSVADIQEFLLGERVHAPSHNNYHSSRRHCHRVRGEDAQTVQQANLFEDEHLPTRSRTPDSDMESMATAPEDSENKSSAGPKPQVTRRHSYLSYQPGHRPTKCRYREVDFSELLRSELYGREEYLNDLKKQILNLTTAHDLELKTIEEGSQQRQCTSEAAIEAQKEEITQFQEVILRLKSECETYRAQIDQRHTSEVDNITKLQQLESDLERIHTQSDQRTSEVENEGHKKIAELQDVIQRLENEHETHRAETDQRICNVKTEGQRSIAKLQETIQQLESEREVYRTQSNERTTEIENGDQKKIADLQEVIQQLESDLERIRTQSDQRTSEVESESHKKIAELQDVIQRLENERETHRAETDQHICNVETEGQRSIAKLQEIIQQLESEREAYRTQSDEGQKKIVDLQEVIQRLESEHEAYRAQMDQTSEVEIEISKLKETIQWLESEQATHHTQSERDRQTDVEHKNKIAQLQRDIQQRESDRQATTLHHKNEIEQLLKRHEAENTGLRDQLDKIQRTVTIEQKVEIEMLRKEMKVRTEMFEEEDS
ncbi:hypothetical protein JVU11DRAFT_11833 [Chiua virens]|nr:hypothetical protein JVU11DRAFT_11833 [Chiua virens]